MNSQWCSITEYSRRLNVSEMTVRRRIKSGKLVTKMSDGKYYIDMSNVNNDLTAIQQTPAFARLANNRTSIKTQEERSKGSQFYLDKYRQQEKRKFDSPLERKKASHPNQLNQDKPQETNHSSHLSIEVNEKKNEDFLTLTQAILTKVSHLEESLIEQHNQKISSFQELITELKLSLQAKDHELGLLKQKQEDLELLVKMLESSAKK